MNIKRLLISGVTAVVAVVLIMLSIFSNSILIAGTWTPDLTEYEIDEYEETNEKLYDETEETTIFEVFGGMEFNTDGEKPVKGTFSLSGDKITTKLGKDEKVTTLYKVTDNSLRFYEKEEDFYLNNTTDYKRLGGISLAMILRIIGIVLLVAAVVLFVVLKDHNAPKSAFWADYKKFVISGALAVVAVFLVVLTFINTTWQVAGTWKPRYTNLQKEEYLANYGEEFNPDLHKTNFNVYGRMFVKTKDLTEAYEYSFYNGKIYQKMLSEEEPGVFIDDGGDTASRMYKFKNGYLYIYDSEEKLSAGYFDKYERDGLSFVWLIRIIAIVLVGAAAAVFFLMKSSAEEDEENEGEIETVTEAVTE